MKGRCPAGVQDKNRPNLASIQLRRRRPKAVDGLAISSQSPFSVVGENFPIANQGRVWIPSPWIVSRRKDY